MSSTITERQRINTSSAVKVPCKATTTANITLSGEQTIDGVACVTNNRVLVKDQTDATENGIYIVNTSSWSRARDWDGAFDVKQGTFVYVTGGTSSGFWYVTTSTDPIIPGTTSVTIAQASSQLVTFSAFAQLLLDDADATAMFTTLGISAFIQTLLDDANAATARTTLGAVGLTGDETIADVKTFSSAPVMSAGATVGTAAFDSSGVMTAGTVPMARLGFKGALVYKTSNQSTTTATPTSITFDSESYDTDAFHDTSTNTDRLTVPSGVSKVRIHARIIWASSAIGDRELRLSKNGSENFAGHCYVTGQAVSIGEHYLQFTSAPLSVSATDYFTVAATQTSGGALNVLGNANGLLQSWFAIEVLN